MPLLDYELILTRQPSGVIEQTLTAAAADTPVATTKFIDLGAQGAAKPYGSPIAEDFGKAIGDFNVQATTQWTGVGGSVSAQLVQDDDGAGTNLEVIQQTRSVPVAELVPGFIWPLGKPEHGVDQRCVYVRLLPTGAAVTGKFTASYAVATP